MKIKDKVLIVEDEQSISSFISMILTANGYDTIIVNTGEEALTMISSHCPDLIVLDLGLPDMDGVEVLRSVRKWSSLPIVVVSARNHERDKVEALDYGADDYLVKPFGTSELLARIRTAIRHTQASGADPRGKCPAHRQRVSDRVPAGQIRRQGADLRLHHQGAVGPQGQKRQPDPAGEYGQYPPQDRGKSRPAQVHLHGGGRGLPDA